MTSNDIKKYLILFNYFTKNVNFFLEISIFYKRKFYKNMFFNPFCYFW